MKTKFITGQQAAELIKDGDTIATVAMTLVGASETVLKALEKRFLETGSPKNLTLFHSCGQSDRERGIGHLAHEGMVTRIIGSHWGLQPRWMEMIAGNKVDAYCMPQGQMAQLYRSMACGLPGKLSKVGLQTFLDPRLEGGKMNERTQMLPDLIDVIEINGDEFLLYHSIPLNVVLIRGTKADEMGNITMEEEAMKLESLSAVLAAKRFGGIVIAQVKHEVEKGTLHPKQIEVPGVHVDAVVVCDNPQEDHRQTSSWFYDPSYCGDIRTPVRSTQQDKLDARKVIGRRAMMLLQKGAVINLGTGIPNDVIGKIAAEEDLQDDIMITVESGIYGGVSAGGIDFGISKNPTAIVSHSDQFDYYNGAGVDFTFMGVGEMDCEGNVNSTKMGNICPGAGGFVDITQNAKNVVFCTTFTAKGLEIDFSDGKVKIKKEGQVKKLVEKVLQISYNGLLAREKGQKMHVITERAVFELRKEGPVLIEIAPGIDLKKDILEQMEFTPIIDSKLKITDAKIYEKSSFGLKGMLASASS